MKSANQLVGRTVSDIPFCSPRLIASSQTVIQKVQSLGALDNGLTVSLYLSRTVCISMISPTLAYCWSLAYHWCKDSVGAHKLLLYYLAIKPLTHFLRSRMLLA